jgi:hypothetical protein
MISALSMIFFEAIASATAIAIRSSHPPTFHGTLVTHALATIYRLYGILKVPTSSLVANRPRAHRCVRCVVFVVFVVFVVLIVVSVCGW